MAATYFKYAERDADAQINWAEVGKGLSDMLAETNRVREEKKAAIDEATRQFQNELLNAPQGQNQDINNFTNKFAHNMMEQMRIDEQLLKSGRMPLQKYTLRRQNYVDGTNQLFELSKLYQDEFSKKMQGVNSGELQAINIFNMGMVEGYADFNNSEAIIDSMGDGRVNLGLYETKIIDGKPVKVLSKNLAPVNVIRGKILQNVPTFKVEQATDATVKGFGSRKDVLYQAATLAGAGSIAELMGPDFLATKKDPTTQKIVNDMNQAIDDQIGSYFANPYNLTSVLTQNTGKYSSDSFTFDKDEAAKDASKILVKVDPNTNMTTIDPDAPNYEAQYNEAKDWVRTNILSKIDQERTIKTTAQVQRQDEPESTRKAREGAKAAESAAGAWNQLYTGATAAEKKAAAEILLGTPMAQEAGLLEINLQENGKIKLVYTDPIKNRTIDYIDESNNPISLRDFSALGVELHGVVDRDKAVKAGGGGTSFGKTDTSKVVARREGPADETVSFSVPNDLFTIKSVKATANLKNLLPAGFTVIDKGGTFGNDVHVYAPGKSKAAGDTPYIFNANLSASEIPAAKEALELFINDNIGKGELDE